MFGGRRVVSAAKWNDCVLSRILVPRSRVRALNQEKTRDAMGVDKASLLAADLAAPQAWGLAMQRHPAAFDVIEYSSRFSEETCLALFDRGQAATRLHEDLLGPLSEIDPAVAWLNARDTALV